MTRRQTIDPLKTQLCWPWHAEMLHATIGRIGEVNRATVVHNNIVGRIELLALKMRTQDLAHSIRCKTNQRRGGMLADNQVELGIVGHAVALVGRAHDFRDTRRIPAPAHIPWHVGKQ